GAPKSATATHILHLKQLKSPGDILRYVKGVVFPGKTFMIDKYSIKRPRLFWLWYPYRWWVALRAVVGLRR
ncbi:hypothetical protein JZU68_08985, partial [bacterium]|nr:hypothetical protein [bacterium]